MPHTKQQLKDLLTAAGVRPRHKWGQNFLIDLNLMRMLVRAAALQGNETILEVGCGTGSMTALLAEGGGAVVAVDVDRTLAEIAERELELYDNVAVVCNDVLAGKNAIAPSVREAVRRSRAEAGGEFCLIANLPYQAASPLIVNLLLEKDEGLTPDGMFVTVQAEVAERMAAEPGTKAYGLLSILMQAIGEVRRLRVVKPQAFWPQPKVNSAMIAWRRDPERCAEVKDMVALKKTVDLLLRHRRKKIKTCLAGHRGGEKLAEVLDTLAIDPNGRGETLSVQQYVQLSNLA